MDIDIMAVMECTEYVMDRMDTRYSIYIDIVKRNQWLPLDLN